MHKRIPYDQEIFKAKRQAGATYRELGALFGGSVPWVQIQARRLGLTKKKRGRPQAKLSDEQEKRLIAMRRAGFSYEEIADYFDRCAAWVYLHAIDLGVAGKVCPHCGHSIANPRRGRPRNESLPPRDYAEL